MPTRPRSTSNRPAQLVAGLALIASVAGCGGAAPGPGGADVSDRASEGEWRALATTRPQPLSGAARISVGRIQIVGEAGWSDRGVAPELALSELVAAGLLRRRDMTFVERRRFSAAVTAEREGAFRGANAPRVGISPGAEFVLAATWSTVGMESAFLDVRLTDAETGDVAASWRGTTENRADPIALARAIVGGARASLADLDRLPSWTDPLPGAVPDAYRPSDIPAAAVQEFLRGLAAEERWSWERARAGYQAAVALGGPDFFEAEAVLARTARLRNGGTLGAS